MTKILVLGTTILAAGVTDDGLNWVAPGQIIPKNVAVGALVVDVELPDGFTPTAYTWNGSAVELAPVAPPPALPRQITKLAFRNRFTVAEKVAIDLASIDNPAADMATRQQSAAVRVSLADAAAATYIDLAREDTRAGVTLLETAGILGAGRAMAILDAEILDEEQVK
jgi:hypothetical protein